MTAALRLVPTSFPPTAIRPDFRPSNRPTLVPESRPTKPTSGTTVRVSAPDEAPPTQRSASIPVRAEAAARQEAYSLLAVMRMNADFLTTLIEGGGSPVAREALDDLQRGIDRLERRFALSKSVLPRR